VTRLTGGLANLRPLPLDRPFRNRSFWHNLAITAPHSAGTPLNMPANSKNLQRPFHKEVYDKNLGRSLRTLWASACAQVCFCSGCGFGLRSWLDLCDRRQIPPSTKPPPPTMPVTCPQYMDGETALAVPLWDGLSEKERAAVDARDEYKTPKGTFTVNTRYPPVLSPARHSQPTTRHVQGRRGAGAHRTEHP